MEFVSKAPWTASTENFSTLSKTFLQLSSSWLQRPRVDKESNAPKKLSPEDTKFNMANKKK